MLNNCSKKNPKKRLSFLFSPVEPNLLPITTSVIFRAKSELGFKQHSYGNIPVGQFDSKAEARRYSALLLAKKQGLISNLKHHVLYRFSDGSGYEADFVYIQNGNIVVEDVKHPKLLHQRKFIENKQKMLKEKGLRVLPIHPSKVLAI